MHIQKLITVYDPELDSLPSELRAALTGEDARAIREGPPYFKKLARKAKYGWLKKLLENCGKCKGWSLEFTADGDQPLVPYFRFYWGGVPGLCLPRGTKRMRGLPAVLDHFYSLLGGFRENEFGMAGGVYRLDSLFSIADLDFWLADEDDENSKRAIPFLATFNGDSLCFWPRGGGWYRHEKGRIESVKSLEKEIARYFTNLLAGNRI